MLFKNIQNFLQFVDQARCLIKFYYTLCHVCMVFLICSFSNTTEPSSLMWSGQVSRTPATTDIPINLTFAVDSVSCFFSLRSDVYSSISFIRVISVLTIFVFSGMAGNVYTELLYHHVYMWQYCKRDNQKLRYLSIILIVVCQDGHLRVWLLLGSRLVKMVKYSLIAEARIWLHLQC